MNKAFIIGGLFLSAFLSTQTAVQARNISPGQRSCLTKITKDEMEFLLKDAPPSALKSLENPEVKKKQIENLRQLLALACAATKQGFADDPKVIFELEEIRIQSIAVDYDGEINKDKGKMPFGFIGDDRIAQFWKNNPDREAEFKKFFDVKIELAKESGQFDKDRVGTEDEIKQAREYFAKTRIYYAEATRKWAELSPDFRRKIDLTIKLQQAQYLSRLYAEKILVDKTRVTDEEIEKYIADHPELDTKAQKAVAEKILLRAKSGEDFAKLAQEFSEDPGSKDKGGLYVNVPLGQMVPEFEQAALALKPGQIAPNLVVTQYGLHIVKLEKKGEITDQNGEKKQTYDVRHILIMTTVRDPDNPTAQPVSPKDLAKSKLEEQKEKKVLDEVIANNPVYIAEDFEIPKVSDEQMQKMMQQQMQLQMPQQEMETAVKVADVTLPAKIKKYLNLNYRGWKLASTSDFCSEEYRRNVISGDFDGDGKTDYSAKIIRGKKGFLLAFLERKNSYMVHILHATTASEIKDTALGVFRKGEKYTSGDEEGESSSSMILKNDAPFDGPCASDTGGIHLYRNGKFIAY